MDKYRPPTKFSTILPLSIKACILLLFFCKSPIIYYFIVFYWIEKVYTKIKLKYATSVCSVFCSWSSAKRTVTSLLRSCIFLNSFMRCRRSCIVVLSLFAFCILKKFQIHSQKISTLLQLLFIFFFFKFLNSIENSV